jgi:repressor LexA
MTIPKPPKLTDRQQQVLAQVSWYIKRHGRPPTLRESAAVLHISIDTVRRELAVLNRKGAIVREPGKARAIRITPPAPVAEPAAPPEGRGPRQFTSVGSPTEPALGYRATRSADVVTLLRHQREQQGITQRALAEELGCHHRAVTYWEGGHRGLSLDQLFDLLVPLELDVVLVPRGAP